MVRVTAFFFEIYDRILGRENGTGNFIEMRVISYSFTEDFIQNVADYIQSSFLSQNKDISKLAIVFGGKRPSLFLKRELSKRIGKSFFPPCFFSIDEFIEYVLRKKESFVKISDLDACFIIYNLAKTMFPEVLQARKSFSEFLPWAREILAFIEQLDLEDIQPEALKNITYNARIGYDVPQSINLLLQNIISLRDAYHTVLKEKKTYSRGLLYLLAKRYVKQVNFEEFDKILFCNFFYLHRTEEEIIKDIYERDKAILLFQGNEEEWSVLKNIAKNFSCSIVPLKEAKPAYKLSLYSAFDTHSEVCLVREILKKIENLERTVIVLPDPDNIVPLLSEITPFVKEFNVSMGYPLKRSSLSALFTLLFKSQTTRRGNEYYTKDYLRVLRHPFIKNLKILPEPSITRVLVHKIEEILLGMVETPLGGSLFVNLKEIENLKELYILTEDTLRSMGVEVKQGEIIDILKELHTLLFYTWENLNNFYEFSLALEKFVDILVEKSFLASYPLNLRIAEKILSIKEELKNAVFSKETFSREDMFKIFENKLESEVISFAGSPLKGLQILGLLETRSLNFDHVIIMDTNESVLPKLRLYEPLIPREVMLNLGLNRLEKEEEIQRYQFMRLISSAKNVYLVYEESKDKEKSRFIEELIWEREKESNTLNVVPVTQAHFEIKVLPHKKEIRKNPEVIKFLENFVYSASSINTYIHCPLRFYYQYVLGLKEKEDLQEDPEGAEIGQFIHKLLEETFGRFIGRKPNINKNFKDFFFNTLERNFEETFQKRMKSDSFLLKEIIKARLGRFLQKEEKREIEKIICLEREFYREIMFSEVCCKFMAKIDRIDRVNDGSILIIDYKTGGREFLPKGIDKLEKMEFSRESIKNIIQSFQLPLYLYFMEEYYQGEKVIASLYNLRTLEIDSFPKDALHKEEVMDVCMKALRFVVNEIMDPGVTFTPDEEDARYCRYCPFFYLCR